MPYCLACGDACDTTNGGMCPRCWADEETKRGVSRKAARSRLAPFQRGYAPPQRAHVVGDEAIARASDAWRPASGAEKLT